MCQKYCESTKELQGVVTYKIRLDGVVHQVRQKAITWQVTKRHDLARDYKNTRYYLIKFPLRKIWLGVYLVDIIQLGAAYSESLLIESG